MITPKIEGIMTAWCQVFWKAGTNSTTALAYEINQLSHFSVILYENCTNIEQIVPESTL